MPNIVLIAHNLRSCHNVGSLLRTVDGLGITKVYLTGYTPYPAAGYNDSRLPHEAQKLHKQISKTALGAEITAPWQHTSDILKLIIRLKKSGYHIVALEQMPKARLLPTYKPPQKIALIVGRELEGIESEILSIADDIVEIPMSGRKESFNVAVAAAIALYHCLYNR